MGIKYPIFADISHGQVVYLDTFDSLEDAEKVTTKYLMRDNWGGHEEFNIYRMSSAEGHNIHNVHIHAQPMKTFKKQDF